MSEKRFVDHGCESIEDSGFEDVLTGKNYYVDYFYEIVDLLNSLNGENEQLKQYKLYEDNKRLQTIIADLKEENEQLRQTTKTQQIRIYCQDKEIQKLNEQLNKIPNTIKEVWLE